MRGRLESWLIVLVFHILWLSSGAAADTNVTSSTNISSSAANDTSDEITLYFQKEVYLLESDGLIQFDCPGDNLTLYISSKIDLNSTIEEYGQAFTSGIVLIPNNFTSYCPDVGNFTLLGYKDLDQNFTDEAKRNHYISTMSDPDYQYIVIILNEYLGSDEANRSITFDATASDYRAIMGTFDTPPAELDILVSQSYESVESTNSSADDSAITSSKIKKRANYSSLIKTLPSMIKGLKSLANPLSKELVRDLTSINNGLFTTYRNGIYVVQSARYTYWLTHQPGQSGTNPFKENEVPNFQIDLAGLSRTPGYEGYTYELNEFYFAGQLWPEIWRRIDPNYKATPTVKQPGTSNQQPQKSSATPPIPSVSSSASTPSATAAVPKCAWRRNKTPHSTQKDTGFFGDAFKIDAERLLMTGNVSLAFKQLVSPDTYVNAYDQAASVYSALKNVTELLDYIQSNPGVSPKGSSVASSVPSATLNAKRAYIVKGVGSESGLLHARAVDNELRLDSSSEDNAADLVSRADDDDNYDFQLKSLDIDFRMGNTSASVIPPSVKFSNYAFYSSGSIYLRSKKSLVNDKKVFNKRLVAIPIGGCATSEDNPAFAIDAFFMIYLSGMISTGANGSFQVDFSYQWDPFNFEVGLGEVSDSTNPLGNGTFNLDLNIAQGFKLNYARLSTDLPDLTFSLVLAPAIQLDVTLLSASYSRGLTLGPAFNIATDISASAGYKKDTTTSKTNPSTTTSSPNAVQTGSNYTMGSLNSISINKGISAMRFALAMTTYKYGSISGSYASYLFTLPSYSQTLTWLWGPKDIANTVKD